MVLYEKETAHFNFRVAGVAIHNGRVLLDRNTRNSYWVLPGGHPDMMEPLSDALRREMREEIGAEVEVVRLLWLVENFYHRGKDIHELGFYFLVNLQPDSPLLQGDGPFYGDEYGQRLIFQWYPLVEKTLLELPLYPSYLAKALLSIPASPEHAVHNDMPKPVDLTKTQDVKKSSGAKVDNFLSIP